MVWAQESFLYAQNTTYPYIMTTNKLNDAYTSLAYQTSKKRITLAGYRLANFVINLYKNAPGREQPLKVEDLKTEVGLPLHRRSAF